MAVPPVEFNAKTYTQLYPWFASRLDPAESVVAEPETAFVIGTSTGSGCRSRTPNPKNGSL